MSSPREWTPAQVLGIRTVGKSLLVSAAAGSGKTAMLSERCAYLVCDAPEPHRCDVDELLVVTFTDAAAAEMRERIGRAIRHRVAMGPGEELELVVAVPPHVPEADDGVGVRDDERVEPRIGARLVEPGDGVVRGEAGDSLVRKRARVEERAELDGVGVRRRTRL